MNQAVGPANNSPAFVADPTDHRFVVLANRLDAPDYGCALQVSGDGGRSWLPASRVGNLARDGEKCYAPEVEFDRHGVLYLLFVGLAGDGNRPVGAYLTKSTDRAQTFSHPRRVLGPSNFSVRMALDPDVGENGRIHLVWLHAGAPPAFGGFAAVANPIEAAFSDDGGKTFSEPVTVSDGNRPRVVAPALALGADHAVHVAYFDLGDDARDYQGLEGPVWDGTWSVILATSSDGGRSFSAGVVVDGDIEPYLRVMLIFTMPPPSLVSDSDGRVCLAWTDARHGDEDALLRCSVDGGRRWEDVRRINDDRLGNGARQYLPQVSIAPGGRVDAVFLDRRDDRRNSRFHAYFTTSHDGGRTFVPNVRLSAHSSSSQRGQQYAGVAAEGQFEFGGRLGLLSRGDSAVAAWPDTRNSVEGVPTEQDLFTATVLFPGSQRVIRWPIVALVALLTLGAASLAWRSRRRRAVATE